MVRQDTSCTCANQYRLCFRRNCDAANSLSIGTRLLPEGWADYARTPRAADDEGSVYGAHWWVWDPDAGVFASQGYETQRILVDPGADAVVVRLGKTPIEKAPHVDAWLRDILDALR